MTSSNPPSIKIATIPISPNTQIGLSLSNLITVVVVVAGGVLAYSKVPDEERVKAISAESSRAATESFAKSTAEERGRLSERIKSLEREYANTRTELTKMNDRMDKMLILLAGGSAGGLRSTTGRRAAEKVRQNLEDGDDPLSGLGLSD